MPEDKPTLFRGGEVASETAPPERADVLVARGKVEQVGLGLPVPDGAEVLDCNGKILIPGMFDLHVHTREDCENLSSCSAAALRGGVTGALLMPDTSPAIDGSGPVQSILDSIAEYARIEMKTAGCLTKGRGGEELAGIGAMGARGVRMITDADLPVSNPLVLRRAMEYARDHGLFVGSHCETPELSEGGAMHEGAISYQLGLPGLPAISEEICLYRDARLAQYTNCPIHIQQVSTAKAMKAVRFFKEQGVAITCEVSPHHLIFCDDDIVDYDTNLKTNPPLRPADDRAQLVQGLLEGVIDCIASDHSPHTEFEKNRAFGNAPSGITGLDTAVVALHHHLIKPGRLPWEILVRRYSAEPRRLLGLEPAAITRGNAANFFLFDPKGSTSFTTGSMGSKSSNTPFLDQTMDGRIESVVFG